MIDSINERVIINLLTVVQPMPKRSSTQAKSIFTERIKDYMDKIGVSQAELSRRTGIATTQINRYMAGTAPAPENIVKIANALGTTIDYLFGRIETPEIPKFLSAEEKELFDAYRRGDSERVVALLAPRIAQAFLDNPDLLEHE